MGLDALTPDLKVGLTGGIGSGKTTVSNLFAALGVPIIDADVIARELVEPGQPAYREVIREFGDEIVDDRGELRRDALRRIVFSEPGRKGRLEAILHPRVRDEIERRVNQSDFSYCIISIPLLFETGRESSVDRILVVDVPEGIQLSRAYKRDGANEEAIRKIMATQATRELRLAGADDIIHNNLDLEHLRRQVNLLHDKYLVIASNSLQ